MEAVAPLQILGLTIVLRVNSRVSDVLVRAVGDVYSRTWRKITFAIVMITSCMVGQKWGLVGVSYAVLFANIINFALMATLTFKSIHIHWWGYLKLYKKSVLLAILFGIILYAIETLLAYFTQTDILILSGSLIISFIITTLLILKLKAYFLSDIRVYLELLLKKLKLNSLSKLLN